MAADAAMVARVRRLAAEPTTDTYSDSDLEEIIERYPLLDAEGNDPDDSEWTATYDLNLAAAEVWDEKAAALAGYYDFSADNASFKRSQAYQQALSQATRLRARRSAVSVTQNAAGPFFAPTDGYIGNAPEDDDL